MGATCTSGWIVEADASRVHLTGQGPALILERDLFTDPGTHSIVLEAEQLESHDDATHWTKTVPPIERPQQLQPFGAVREGADYDVTYVGGHPTEVTVVEGAVDGHYVGSQVPFCQDQGCRIVWPKTATVRFDRVGEATASLTAEFPFGQQNNARPGQVRRLEVDVLQGALRCGDRKEDS